MFDADEQRTERELELTEEAMALMGMVAEIRSKCILLRNRMRDERERCQKAGIPLDRSPLLAEVTESTLRMRGDLNRYSTRLKEINQDLEAHERFS